MSVGHRTSESLHKSGAQLLVSPANEVKAPTTVSTTQSCHRPLLMATIKEEPELLLYTMTWAIIYLEDGLR